MTRVLLVPGRGVAKADHWAQQWARDRGYRWAPEPPGPPYRPAERVADLERVLGESDEPAILVAHSAGCLTVAYWAERQPYGPPTLGEVPLVSMAGFDKITSGACGQPAGVDNGGPVVGALLVTPPYVEEVPRRRLPFRAIVVASRDDPHAVFGEQERFAREWGAELVDAGNVGHLDSATGFGPWPQGEELLDRLRRAAAAG
ncbi:RBBP9/YdeN family alpha/beta hydrolase [Actinoplanes sp. HUAS TT8]|uniref:RBBP9/YdeN family alpha/beta hydrolase n=1 Tax=Actinoplanes sp. HUAS TT8 TaxID=3447453 RepID=UPI003F51DD05